MSQSISETTKIVQQSVFVPPAYDSPHVIRQLDEMLGSVASVVAPVWPLKDYVAINPFAGLSERRFTNARAFLRTFSDCETLMPLSYYAEQFKQGEFLEQDIEAALNDATHSIGSATKDLTVDGITKLLAKVSESGDGYASGSDRRVFTLAEKLDIVTGSHWSRTVVDEVGKFCASYYDEGQAIWSNPMKDLPVYQAWKSMAKIDRNIEVIGLPEFADFVDELPDTAGAAIVYLLNQLDAPEELWESILLAEAFSVIGWSAWTQYTTRDSLDVASENDFASLVAIRLAYDVALGKAFGFSINWTAIDHHSISFDQDQDATTNDSYVRAILLAASENAYQRDLLGKIQVSQQAASKVDAQRDQTRKLAQMVFCIDVRSERYRRNLESFGQKVETHGFAGFFGLPIEFVSLGEKQGSANVPVLLKPKFKLHETYQVDSVETYSIQLKSGSDTPLGKEEVLARRSQIRNFRSMWQKLQSSALGCFPFVETMGFAYGWKLIQESLPGKQAKKDTRFDGIPTCQHDRLGPSLQGLNAQGITTTEQADLAEGILRGTGLVENLARLVVFAGHGCETSNNPLKSGLDCGACGGHSGEPNARLAALLLNQPYLRNALADRGIEIPGDTMFVAAFHNTTTDEVSYFDTHLIPETHSDDLAELKSLTEAATRSNQAERAPVVDSDTIEDLVNRSSDWSEVRPEWGLTGNAAFVIGPRSLTEHADLDGRVFLHSYRSELDPQDAVLEQIMTAPMVVAQWINMQYYASAVDQSNFGSGSKTIHNVVGRFGILSGGGGDLMTGLPIESLHDGNELRHAPQRLTAVIAASRDSIDKIIGKHESVNNLATNGWMNLVAVEGENFFRLASDQSWEHLSEGCLSETV